jgi:MoaA/NifB/PqqE/SkfB family radical SAM enzyme
MCNHHSINSENELRLPEIELTLDYIKDLGTKNIIISGGEPLYREDFLQILEKAKANDLNIGLLTNGIKYGGESITNKDAQKIKETCDWIQLSIDSFNDSNYAKIRNYDINIVKQSLTNLQAARLENKIEIAFTIQRDNIDEAIQIIKTEENAFNTPIYIRFKFAHGYDNENKFLLSDKKTELNEFLRNCKKSEKFNTEYISKMFTDGYFNIDDTIKGTPLSTRNNIFNKDGFICHVLNYSCKIDAKGDIYPCCFLFDDNKGENSQIRKEHKLGSLRDKNGIIPPLEDGHNLLKEILATKIPSYSKLIPIHDEACNNCIRHFYQNAFFNDFHKVNEDNKDINFIYSDSETADTLNTEIWL